MRALHAACICRDRVAVATADRDYAQLPSGVLVQILQLVDARHRLSSCSLVHSTWAAAALAASSSISINKHDYFRVKDLKWWLWRNGDHVGSLKFNAKQQPVSQLPCSSLRELAVARAKLQLRPGPLNYWDNMLEVTTGLTRLVPRRCYMRRRRDNLAALSTLTDLQHLMLDRVVLPHASLAHADTTDSNTWAPIPGSLCSQLLKLTHLELSSGVGGMTQETFQHISCLTDLQYLGLTALKWDPDGPHNTTVYGLVGLSRLTQLTCF